MEKIILIATNIKKIVGKLNEYTLSNNYWFGVTTEKITEPEDPKMNWFQGVGTYERLVKPEFKVLKNSNDIEIYNKYAFGDWQVIPRHNIILFESVIEILDKDIIWHDLRGDTYVYMAQTKERIDKYTPPKKIRISRGHRFTSLIGTGMYCSECGGLCGNSNHRGRKW